MVNPNDCTRFLGEKEMLGDCLSSQKQIASGYNTYAGECVNEQLRSSFLNILDDEHRIQATLFCDMQSRGWYQTQPAEQQKINDARQKFLSAN